MTLTVSPQIETRLFDVARQEGLDPSALIEKLVMECRPAPQTQTAPAITAKNAAAIAWIDQRLAEEATDDPEEIRKAQEELDELKRNMNANRAATGERLVFP